MRMCLILALFSLGVFSMGDLKHSLYLKIFLWHTVSQSSAFHIISNDPVHPRDLLQLRTHDLNILVFRQSSPEETMDKAETVWQPCWWESLLFPYINNESLPSNVKTARRQKKTSCRREWSRFGKCAAFSAKKWFVKQTWGETLPRCREQHRVTQLLLKVIVLN